jgi:hypothetical protein
MERKVAARRFTSHDVIREQDLRRMLAHPLAVRLASVARVLLE